MHTYLKVSDGYAIGMWLSGPEGNYFQRLFKVDMLRSAFRAVNILNGGTGDTQSSLVFDNLSEE